MSPQTKKRVIHITITSAAIASAALAALAWGMPSAKSVAAVVDNHWVRSDSFQVFQQSLERQHIADTNSVREELRQIRGATMHTDSMLRCDHGHRDFCP